METKTGSGVNSYLKKLKAENELLKKKLSREFGMSESGPALDPETENLWLKHIYEFETVYAGAKTSRIYDIIGKPEFKPAVLLDENEMRSEIRRFTAMLKKKNIILENVTGQDPKKVYRFIIDEVFEEKTKEMNIEGLELRFVYEDVPAVN
ncbi:MAG: hypothetical protein JSS91_02105 [Bacteroidetes bacterium]|nr:hypothetical protein [Bacteroidota bacterium]